ncbi:MULTISPECIES: hypothetical protein [Streptomyces]|uniref:Scaffolding protein n=1 Tax=Streptomyces dengpaensis TaxID=2049881 RepID=A0ABM6SUK0_9ACTN|nr:MULTISPECIES: hypothetical protein [Streptomyces]AVH58388.1 hypothetical protein C4B68_24405 [Streptomyces dengpaensis]PIB06063.1 hypothetical protein B1C81_26125 [Streptomyces sp. HG99]
MTTAFRHPLATHTADTILGYRRDGRPIYAIAGGDGTGEGGQGGQGGQQGDPGNQPTGQDPASAAPTTPQQPATPAAPANEDPAATIARLTSELTAARKDAGKSRVTAKQQAADDARNELAQQIGKALGIVKDDAPADPAQLTQQLAAEQAKARQTAVELAVYRTAPAAGANPDALLDSRAFADAVAALDPTDTDGITAAIKAAVTANPRLAGQAPKGPERGGAEFNGPPAAERKPATLEQAIAARMSSG